MKNLARLCFGVLCFAPIVLFISDAKSSPIFQSAQTETIRMDRPGGVLVANQPVQNETDMHGEALANLAVLNHCLMRSSRDIALLDDLIELVITKDLQRQSRFVFEPHRHRSQDGREFSIVHKATSDIGLVRRGRIGEAMEIVNPDEQIGPLKAPEGVFGGIGRFNSSICGTKGDCNGNQQSNETSRSNPYLNLIQRYGLLGSFSHFPLFAQIGLVMALSLAAFGLIPIGLYRLFPLNADRTANHNGKGRGGVLFILLGLGSFGLLSGIIFSV